MCVCVCVCVCVCEGKVHIIKVREGKGKKSVACWRRDGDHFSLSNQSQTPSHAPTPQEDTQATSSPVSTLTCPSVTPGHT